MLRLSGNGTPEDVVPAGLRPATSEDLKTAFEKYQVALDTNILTFIYKCDKELAEDIGKVLGHLKERIFISYQVAREFDRHRPMIEKDAAEPKRKLSIGLKQFKNDSHKHVRDYWRTSNPSGAQELSEMKEYKIFVDSIAGMIEKVSSPTADAAWVDDLLSRILDGAVLPARKYGDYMGLVRDSQDRAAKGIPPAFEDWKNKGIDWRRPEGGAGDYIIWKDIIDRARNSKNKDVLFVTNDQKPDFWDKLDKKDFPRNIESRQPHFLLSREFYEETGGIVRFVRIDDLVLLAKQLGVDLRDESYEEAASLFIKRPGNASDMTLYPAISRVNSTRGSTDRDSGVWDVSADVREQCLPIIVSEGGRVVRAWEVISWYPDGGKWRAHVGDLFTTQSDFDEAQIPIELGAEMPHFPSGDYAPMLGDELGNLYRRGELLNPCEYCPECGCGIPLTEANGMEEFYGYDGFCSEACCDEDHFQRMVEKN